MRFVLSSHKKGSESTTVVSVLKNTSSLKQLSGTWKMRLQVPCLFCFGFFLINTELYSEKTQKLSTLTPYGANWNRYQENLSLNLVVKMHTEEKLGSALLTVWKIYR